MKKNLFYVKVVCFYIASINFLYAGVNTTNKEIFTYEEQNPLYALSSKNPIAKLLEIQNVFPLTSIVDIGCGNPKWLTSTILPFTYCGVDIVDSIIEKNILTYPNASFVSMDVAQEKIPDADLILCQNTLEYLSFFTIYNALTTCKNSKASYILLSTYPEQKVNRETSTGLYRKINFQEFPFYFPTPKKLYKEQEGKWLGLWNVQDLNLENLLSTIFPPLTVLSKPVGKPLSWEHPAVMGSVRRGLSQMHPNFSINPDLLSQVKENIFILCDYEAGINAYRWKEQHKIKKLLIGPNMVGTPSEHNGFVCLPLIDIYLHPSEWTREGFIATEPSLENRISLWPAGVDECYWSPKEFFNIKNSNTILVYCKTDFDLCDQVESTLHKLGFAVERITYGHYSAEEFKQACNRCKFAVFISRSESQGIALAEAWSMDLPTLVWDIQGDITYQDVVFHNVSAAPYLSAMTGKKWKNLEELIELIQRIDCYKHEFHPRRWVLLHMTDKVCVEQLLSYIR